MPSQITHIFAGMDAALSLPEGWFSQFSGPAFRLGCQGPDVFYHNRRTKPGAFLYGTRLHRRGWGAFVHRFRKEAIDRGWGPEHPGFAFLVGQATHGFLDRHLHPFVVYYSGWKIPNEPSTDGLRHSHVFLERVLDSLLWRSRMGTSIRNCSWQDDLPGPLDFPADFWPAWAEALHEVFPRLSTRDDLELRLRNAVADTRGFLSFTSPRAHGHAVRAAQQGHLHYFHPEFLPDWDFLNQDHRLWKDPVTGEERRESFFDLYDRAVVEASRALSLFVDPPADWAAVLGNGSLNLPGSEGENMGPRYSSPWDFATLYERETQGLLSDQEATRPEWFP